MTRFSRFASFAVLAMCTSFVSNAQAGSVSINGIAPFDTNLGTLIHALVTLDPVSVQTSIHTAGFGSISSHHHIVAAPPVVVPGLDTFIFASIPSTPTSSGPFADHSHNINLLPSIKSYSGVGLNWFLDAGNPTITNIVVPPFQTVVNEGHSHTVALFPIVPRTTFTFTDPVPEPATLSLLTLGGIALTLRRRRAI